MDFLSGFNPGVCEMKRDAGAPPPVATCHLFDFSGFISSNHFRRFNVFFLHHQNRNKKTEQPENFFVTKGK